MCCTSMTYACYSDRARSTRQQWISEVMHFCAGLPVILVGCKKDLRRDPRVIEELRKTNQRPVTPEEVRCDLVNLYHAPCTRLCGSGQLCARADIDWVIGYGSSTEDRCPSLSRVLGTDG